jgi:hypothetical protein
VNSESVGRTKNKGYAETISRRRIRAIRDAMRLYQERQELICQRSLYLKQNETLRAHVKHWEDLNRRLYRYIKWRISQRHLTLNTGNYWNDRDDFGE